MAIEDDFEVGLPWPCQARVEGRGGSSAEEGQ